MSDEFALNLGNEITVIIVYHKSDWTTTPSTCLVKVGEPASVFFVFGVKDNPLSAV
jgi:hypothetical protein